MCIVEADQLTHNGYLEQVCARGVKQLVCPSVVVVVGGTKMPGSGDIGS